MEEHPSKAPVIIECRCFSRDRNDAEVIISISQPQREPKGDWFCAVEGPELNPSRAVRIFGVTKRQAVRLAIRFAAANLSNWARQEVSGGQNRHDEP
jgi:hypothetical protein